MGRNELLDARGRNVNARRRGRKLGIALVRDRANRAGVRDQKVRARDAGEVWAIVRKRFDL